MSITTLKGATTTYEAMLQAKLNWGVETCEMMTLTGLPVPNHKAVLRDDSNSVLGVVGKTIQNSLQY